MCGLKLLGVHTGFSTVTSSNAGWHLNLIPYGGTQEFRIPVGNLISLLGLRPLLRSCYIIFHTFFFFTELNDADTSIAVGEREYV